jgi:hypothetical protein
MCVRILASEALEILSVSTCKAIGLDNLVVSCTRFLRVIGRATMSESLSDSQTSVSTPRAGLSIVASTPAESMLPGLAFLRAYQLTCWRYMHYQAWGTVSCLYFVGLSNLYTDPIPQEQVLSFAQPSLAVLNILLLALLSELPLRLARWQQQESKRRLSRTTKLPRQKVMIVKTMLASRRAPSLRRLIQPALSTMPR